jgi:predicted glycoside hydrolase/deacetylase ChbG (UPF0249 family)
MRPRAYLVVNADDLGYSRGINRGVFEAHERGIVTSASLMVRRPAAEEAATESRSHPELGVGLHVDFGRQPLEQLEPDAVAAEVHSQIDRFHELVGHGPTHLDSHRHVHCTEPLRSVLAGVAWDLGIPLRHTSAAQYLGEFHGQTEGGEPLPSALRPERLAALLRRLPDGAHELCCHPGYAYGLDSAYGPERELELRTLCDPRLWQVLAEERIALVSFAELREQLAA